MTNDGFDKKLTGYFIAFCRKSFRWSPAYREALARAFVRRDKDGEHYKCEQCGTVIPRKLKQVDHIQPVVDRRGWNGSWDVYRERMFVSADQLRVLCKRDHHEKTQKENKARKAAKKQKEK